MSLSLFKLSLALSFVLMIISFMCFTIFSRRFLEKKINKEERIGPPEGDVIGFRDMYYALSLISKRVSDLMLTDNIPFINKYARKIDYVLAYTWMVTLFCFMINLLLVMWFDS